MYDKKYIRDISAADFLRPPSSEHSSSVFQKVFLRLAAEGLELQMAGSCPVRNFPHKMAGPAPARQRPAANTMTNVQSLLPEEMLHKAKRELSEWASSRHLNPPPATEV